MKSRTRSFFRNLWRGGRIDRELDDELRAFVDMTVDEKKAAGLGEEEARRHALVELGGLDQVKERVRDVRAGALVDQVRQDLVYSVRLLRKHAGFTAITVGTIALGIGSSTAIFSVVDTVLFRPLPYAHPDSLVKFCGTGPRDLACDDDFLPAELERLREQRDVFEHVAADDGTGATVVRPDGTRETLGVGLVTTNWLSTLGVRPAIGRDFAGQEGQPGFDRVVILTNDYWRRHFNSNTSVVGGTLTFDGMAHTVIGVLPPNVLRFYADVLKPLVTTTYSDNSLDLIARLRPGVTPARATLRTETVGRQLETDLPASNRSRRLTLRPLGKYYATVQRKAEQGLILMLGAVGVVLLIACANVANLMLARAGARRRESTLRAALGASRGRLVRQFVLESLLLFVAGGAVGVLVARLSIDWLSALAISGGYVPERMFVATDARVLGFSLLLSLATGLLFGLGPAIQASRVDLNAGLRESTQTLTNDVRRGRARRLLIVTELALSLVLLAGFGLLIRSFERVYTTSGGFDPDNVIVTDSDGGRSFPEAMTFWRAAVERARAIPGVASVALTSRPPVHGARRQRFAIDARSPVPPDEPPEAGDILISADYFRTLRIPLLKGRAFTEADSETSPPVAVISESLARRYFGKTDPIGRRISVLEQAPMTCCVTPRPVEGVWREVVGVVGDVRQRNVDEAPAVTIYRPYAQIVEHDMYLVLRASTTADAGRIVGALRSQLITVDTRRDWWNIRAMWEVIRESESIRLRRFVLILLGSFAAMAMVLAAVGIYGVASSIVVERTKEIGIRMALGATRTVVLRQMLREMLTLAAGGLIVGSAVALGLARLIRTMLFGVTATDGVTYFAVSVLLCGIVVLATCLPARRAMRIDPMVALRYD